VELLETTNQILRRLFESTTIHILARTGGTDEGAEGQLGNTTCMQYSTYTILPILTKQLSFQNIYSIEMSPFARDQETYEDDVKITTVAQDYRGRVFQQKQ